MENKRFKLPIRRKISLKIGYDIGYQKRQNETEKKTQSISFSISDAIIHLIRGEKKSFLYWGFYQVFYVKQFQVRVFL